MRIDLNDAIKMYAKACHTWYGVRAPQVALGRAQELRAQGDWEGVKVWEQLAAELATSAPGCGARQGSSGASFPGHFQRRLEQSNTKEAPAGQGWSLQVLGDFPSTTKRLRRS